jgi:hypothetical protein
VAGIVEVGVGRHLDGEAFLIGFSKAASAVPTVPGKIQAGIRWQLDYLAGSFDLAVTPHALPPVSG